MIIGLMGSKKSGKSTVADYLVKNFNFTKYSFAKPLKEGLKHFFGFTEEQLYNTKEKERIDERYGSSPREFMQWFGTQLLQFIIPNSELAPNLKNRNHWSNRFKDWYNENKENVHNIVIDDLRFKHEYEVIRELGGYSVLIIRDLNVLKTDHGKDLHLSEKEYKDIPYNYIIRNLGDIDTLYNKIVKMYLLFK